MSPPAEPSVPATVAGVQAHLRRRALLAAGLWGAAGIGAVLALAWALAGPEGWRQGSWAPLLLDLALAGIAVGLSTLLAWGVRHWLDDMRVARALEASAGLERGTVEGALQLARAVPAGVSGSLAALAERSVAGRLTLAPARLAGPLEAQAGWWLRRGGAALAVIVPLLTLLAVASPARSISAWAGLGRPLRSLAPAILPPLEVAPGDAEVLRGSPVTVTVRAPGRSEVTLHWQAAGEVAQSQTLPTETMDARFHFAAVNAALEYSASAPDGARSARYLINPVDPLLVSDVALELVFPPHTGRTPEEYQGDVPPLVVPAETHFQFEGRATRSLLEAGLERVADGLKVPLRTVGNAFGGGWTPSSSGIYRWRFLDTDGAPAEIAPAPLDVTVVPDSAPRIHVAFPAVDTVLPMTLRQPLVVELHDDYGVAAMELVAYRVTSLGERHPPVSWRMEMGGTRAALARPLMDLSSWQLLPGDTVRYFARAVDNAPSPSFVETREYVLRVPAAPELRRAVHQELGEMAGRLAQLVERVRQAREEARALERWAAERRELTDRDRVGFGERAELGRALEEQERILEEAERMRTEFEAIAEALREAGEADPQLQRDLEELRSLLAEAASPELGDRMRELGEGAENADARQVRQILEELAREQDQLRERLQESLEWLRRTAVEQELRATTEDARELAQRERALADALHEGGEPELRERQQGELREEAAALRQRMEQLRQRLDSLEEDAALDGVQEARRETAVAEEAMLAAESALQQSGQPPGRRTEPAAERAEQAAQALARAAEELATASQEMSTERAQALQRALERAGNDALSMARRQAAIRQQLRGTNVESVAELRVDEVALFQGLRNVAENLEVDAGGQAAALRETSTRIRRAMQAVERTLQTMEERYAPPLSLQNAAKSAVDALNQLALSALAAGQQAGAGNEASESVTEQLERIAQEQGRVNNRAGQVLPMQLGAQALGELLQQLAQGQEGVAGNLQDLAQQPGAEGAALGDLEALAQEAQALAELLAGGRLDPETRARQDRLFHRLLDAGRTLQNEELSEERDSEVPALFERGEVLPLGLDALGVGRYGLPSAEQLQQLTPAERTLVLRYFDRLNRDARADTPGSGSGSPLSGATPPGREGQGGTR